MKFIIENLVKEPSYLALSQAAKELGYEVQDIKGDFKYSDIAHYQNEEVVFFGCIEMTNTVTKLLKAQGCYPCSFSTFQNYLCQNWYGKFGKYLLNDDYVIVPLSELKRRPYFFFGLFGKEGMIFVRPDSGEKTFKAGLVDFQDFDLFYSQCEQYADDLVVVSSPKTIIGEWRYMCNNKKEIIALSSYRYQGLLTKVPHAPPKATEFVKEILEVGYFPDPVFCVDIAQDGDGNFWLLELTSASSAGMYAMDMKKVVEGVANYA